MAIIETPAQTFIVEYQCDKCLKGNMKLTSRTYMDWQTTFEHKCDNAACNHTAYLKQQYPTTCLRPHSVVAQNEAAMPVKWMAALKESAELLGLPADASICDVPKALQQLLGGLQRP